MPMSPVGGCAAHAQQSCVVGDLHPARYQRRTTAVDSVEDILLSNRPLLTRAERAILGDYKRGCTFRDTGKEESQERTEGGSSTETWFCEHGDNSVLNWNFGPAPPPEFGSSSFFTTVPSPPRFCLTSASSCLPCQVDVWAQNLVESATAMELLSQGAEAVSISRPFYQSFQREFPVNL